MSELALLKMVESRIGSCTGQLQDGLLQTLRLEFLIDGNINLCYTQTLDELITRSEMEVYDSGNTHYSHFIHLHRRGSTHVPAAYNFFPDLRNALRLSCLSFYGHSSQ